MDFTCARQAGQDAHAEGLHSRLIMAEVHACWDWFFLLLFRPIIIIMIITSWITRHFNIYIYIYICSPSTSSTFNPCGCFQVGTLPGNSHDAKELHAKLRPAQCGAVSRHDARSWRCVQLPASIRWDMVGSKPEAHDFTVFVYCDLQWLI